MSPAVWIQYVLCAPSHPPIPKWITLLISPWVCTQWGPVPFFCSPGPLRVLAACGDLACSADGPGPICPCTALPLLTVPPLSHLCLLLCSSHKYSLCILRGRELPVMATNAFCPLNVCASPPTGVESPLTQSWPIVTCSA